MEAKLKKLKSALIVFILLILCLVVFSCGKKEVSQRKGKLRIVTSLFPLYDFARSIGSDKAEITLLLPPGVESHTFEPKPSDIITINNADIFVYTNKVMEPWVADLLKSINSPNLVKVDSSVGINFLKGSDEGEDLHGVDPHIWLDFDNAKKMADNICNAMAAKDPNNKDYYTSNLNNLKSNLDKLDSEYRTGLADCKYKTVIDAGHVAFGYLAKRYNLTFITAFQGFTPDTEPTPKNIAGLVDKIKKIGIQYIYYEELLSPKLAQVLEQETGTKLLPLNAAHNVSRDAMQRGETFISIMQRNLENLRKGQVCK
jgi:zinc transport system substrate-binding protein